MSMNAQQRGDLAEQMLPVACNLTVLVHGDGGPEDVAQVLAGLDPAQKDALLVVLAGLVDPEQPVGKALGWLDFNEDGAMVVPSWSEDRSVRDLAPEHSDDELGDDWVDHAAVAKFVKGFRVDVTDADFIAAVQQCAVMGMRCPDIDAFRRWPVKTTENWLNKLRKRYARSGRVFPQINFVKSRTFTEDDVVTIRERAAAGTTDVLLAVDYDVTRETIRSIVRGQRYPESGGPVRTVRSKAALKASREFMSGHEAGSQAAKPKTEMGAAA